MYVFLLAQSIKFIFNFKIDSSFLKNVWLDPVYCKENCDSYFLLQGRIFEKIFKIFLDSTKLKIVWIKITTFFKRRVSIML